MKDSMTFFVSERDIIASENRNPQQAIFEILKKQGAPIDGTFLLRVNADFYVSEFWYSMKNRGSCYRFRRYDNDKKIL